MAWSKVLPTVLLIGLMPYTVTNVHAHGFLDQENDPSPFSGYSVVCFPEPEILIYQSFKPTSLLLSGVDLRVVAGPNQVGQTIRIAILEDDPHGAVIAEASTLVPPPVGVGLPTAWAHFDFSPPLIVTPHRSYVIGWKGPGSTFWIGSLSDTYFDGQAFDCNRLPWFPGIDMAFRSHAEPSSVRAPKRRGERLEGVSETERSAKSTVPTWGLLKVRYR